MQFAISQNQITLAAADGFRLSVCKLDIKSESDLPSFVVPARALGELSRLLNELGDQNLSMKINEQNTQVEYDLGHSRMIAQLLQGTFPNYEQLIPNEWKTQIRISSKEFIRETKIASIFARNRGLIFRGKKDNYTESVSYTNQTLTTNREE